MKQKNCLTEELDLKHAVQDSAFENLCVIPADISARNIDTLLSDVKHSKKKLKSLLGELKRV